MQKPIAFNYREAVEKIATLELKNKELEVANDILFDKIIELEAEIEKLKGELVIDSRAGRKE